MKLERVGLVVIRLIVALALMAPAAIDAAPSPTPAACIPNQAGQCPGDPLAGNTGHVCVAVPIFSTQSSGSCPNGEKEIPNSSAGGGAIVFYLKLILKFLSSLIGVVIMLMIIVAGVQYMTSSGDPGQIKTAKGRIVSAVIALILFLFMFAILNFLVPGGILS